MELSRCSSAREGDGLGAGRENDAGVHGDITGKSEEYIRRFRRSGDEESCELLWLLEMCERRGLYTFVGEEHDVGKLK